MNSPSEERVMRAREVLAEVLEGDDYNYAARCIRSGKPQMVSASIALQAMLAFSDEGSGIGELREALEPFATFADTFVDADGWNGPMSTTRIVDWFGPSDFRRARSAVGPSPDIDRSGLAQEVE